MIIRSIIYFLILSFLYGLLIHFTDIKSYQAINQRQGNIINAEEYILNKSKSVENVIVGSSLSYRLFSKYFPSNYWNLSQGGGSFAQGVEIIKSSGKFPKVILLEYNILERTITLGENLKPGKFDVALKNSLKINQTKNKPVDYMINLLYQSLNRKEPAETKPNQKSMNVMMALQKEEFNKSLNLDRAKRNITFLKESVEFFENNGVCVIFYEMPIACELSISTKSDDVRKIIFNNFPKNQYKYLPPYPCENYNTTDGVHLNQKSAKRLSTQMVEDIKSISCH